MQDCTNETALKRGWMHGICYDIVNDSFKRLIPFTSRLLNLMVYSLRKTEELGPFFASCEFVYPQDVCCTARRIGMHLLIVANIPCQAD